MSEYVDTTGLLRKEEAAALVGVSVKTITRWMVTGRLRFEYRTVPTRAGNSVRVAFIAASSLPLAQEEPERASRPDSPDVAVVGARSLEGAVRVVAAAEQSDRARLVGLIAATYGVSRRTVYRRLREAPRVDTELQRADRGRPRIPREAYELVVRGIVSNEPTASARIIHRTLLRAAPELMTHKRGGQLCRVSVRTVQRIRQHLADDPMASLMLLDEDERKEFLRVWAGSVMADHANHLWEVDMTRCDTFVVDPETGAIFRPRVHAIIDVYSGCIPAIVFSQEEDQTQTDLLLLRGVRPKPGHGVTADYPVWGIPQRLYWDNAKVYRSTQSERILTGLGVEVVNSKPRVSHSRGAIERFFGTLHGFERTLPGYAGQNAVARGQERIKRLEKATAKWLESGGDPGAGERLLTISEYQSLVLAWLVVDYHQAESDGLSRVAHFTSTAPASTLVEVPIEDLMLLFARRVERTVDSSGRFRLENRIFTIPDGSLVAHQGRKVLVLRDQFALEPDRVLVAWQDRLGKLEVIGEAVPAATVAASVEAHDQRRAAQTTARALLKEAEAAKRDLLNPELRVSTVLMKEVGITTAPELPARARGRLEAIDPTPELSFDPDDEIGQGIVERQRRLDAISDPQEYIRAVMELGKRGE